MNFVVVSPQFPSTYYKFALALAKNGLTVLGIGDTPYDQLAPEVKASLKEYYFCPNMNDYEAMFKAAAFFSFKYGKIDWIESHNEWWLLSDAKLRVDFNVKTGIQYPDVMRYKAKSLMKEYYRAAGVPTARYQIVDDLAGCRAFIEKVGYPVFVKPNVGVGSNNSYRIANEDELLRFMSVPHEESYIMEEFIEGTIVSYDGVADGKSDVVYEASNVFPIPNYLVVNQLSDDFYYTVMEVPGDLSDYGRRVIKAFGVQNRIFHLEFFRLGKDYPHLGKAGELLGLEVNMRPAGGFTPEMISSARGQSLYQAWADVIAYGEIKDKGAYPHHFVAAPARRNGIAYVHSHEEVLKDYETSLFRYGPYPPIISVGMGDYYYMAKLSSLEEVDRFIKFVLERR
ncbi:MAG: carbamoylphosphate synthase large subunit [Bacilli bacterium]|jgi:hypothetical protein